MFKLLSKNKEKKQTMYEEIVSWENLCGAYLDLYKKFCEESKSRSYHAITGESLFDIEMHVDSVLKDIQQDLILKNPCQPATFTEIPKPGGGFRGIYMLTVKDRIKCQALYRVLEPYFEKRYSNYIHSFRSSRPSYKASRSVRKFYLKNLDKNMHVLRTDIHKYADFINKEYLFSVLKQHGIQNDVIELIKLFINQKYVNNGSIMSRSLGTMQGMALSSIFYNIYIAHIDEYIAENVAFYRRVGDDLLLFDNSEENILQLKDYIENEAHKAGIKFSENKLNYGKMDTELFTFHGLLYNNGIIQLPQKNFNKIINKWKNTFRYNEKLSQKQRLKRLQSFLQLDNGPKGQLFMQYIRAYNLVTDTKQIQELSKRFFHILTRYFTGGTSYKNMAKTKIILKNTKFSTLTKLHYKYTNGRINKDKHKY